MRKILILIVLLVAMALGGCRSSQAAPTATPSPAPTVVLDIPVADELSTSSGCTVVTVKPTPGPTPESPFFPIMEADWTRGPAEAQLTLIEYGDFQ